MRNEPIPPDSAPSPEQLVAFLDGELDAPARGRVEAWLGANPAVAEEIEGQRRAVRLWQANPPPEPTPVAWAAAFARIETRLSPAAMRRRLTLPRTLWLGAGMAAAVVAAAFLSRFFQAGGPPDPPLPVIGPGDVVVISMDARDAGGLVVAAPPVQEPILLASQDDVSVMNVEAFGSDDGQVPDIGEGEVPMVVAPRVARAGGREP